VLPNIDDAGSFDVLVTDDCGVNASDAATLVVTCEEIAFEGMPSEVVAIVGENVVLSADVSGTAPVALQWLGDEAPLSDGLDYQGTQTAELVIASVQLEQAGVFRLLAENDCDTAESESVTLVVELPGDLNGDGKVNGADLGILLGFWGPCGTVCLGDIDENGVVDGDDLGTLLGGWKP